MTATTYYLQLIYRFAQRIIIQGELHIIDFIEEILSQTNIKGNTFNVPNMWKEDFPGFFLDKNGLCTLFLQI